jgi:hypothetical protein
MGLTGLPGGNSRCRKKKEKFNRGEEKEMDTQTILRVAAGVLCVIVLVILIQRRRTRVK